MHKRSVSLQEAKRIENDIVHRCQTRKEKFTDPDFPPTSKSVFTRDHGLDPESWKRLGELTERPSLFVDGVGSGDVIQGELGDCWFLGAMSVVATRNDLMYPLFVCAHPEYGMYQIKFYKNGRWRVVTIDDYVPIKWNQLKFAKCQDKDELWVPLMEKAFAKLNGNYESCQSGSFSEGMTDLTGEGCETYDLKEERGRKEEFWDKLVYFSDEAFLMGCSMQGGREQDNGMGLLTGHAYAILRVATTSTGVRLLCIRNPWGQKEWKGAWSDGAREWTPSLAAEMDHHDEDDGTFFMSYEDWLSYFTEFAVCRLLQDEIGTVWSKRIFYGEWGRGSAGGCGNTMRWKENDQYWVTITHPTRVFFHLAQEDIRSQGKKDIEFSIGLYLLKHDSTFVKKDSRTRDETIHTPTFINRREYSMSMDISEGTYVLIPCTFDPDQFAHFILTIYSEEEIECGEVGKGNRPKEYVERFDMESIQWLNRSGIIKEEAPRKSPRRGGVSPRVRGGVSPRCGHGGGGGGLMEFMSAIVRECEGLVADLNAGYDELKFSTSVDKLKAFQKNYPSLINQCQTASDKSKLSDLDKRIKACAVQVREIKMSQRPGTLRGPRSPSPRSSPASIPARSTPSSYSSNTTTTTTSIREAPVIQPPSFRINNDNNNSNAAAAHSNTTTTTTSIREAPVIEPPSFRINNNNSSNAAAAHSKDPSNLRSFSVDDIVTHLRELNVGNTEVFRREGIDGIALVRLNEADLKNELNLNLGDRKKVMLLIEKCGK